MYICHTHYRRNEGLYKLLVIQTFTRWRHRWILNRYTPSMLSLRHSYYLSFTHN